jgi:hypothetical protein
MKRREFVERLGIGSAGIVAGAALGNGVITAAARQHDHQQVTGPLASATVSFGQWMTSPALDRFPDLTPRTANQHLLIPYMPTIKAGGSVNFIVAGFHHIVVYGPGTQLTDIRTDAAVLVPVTTPPPTPPGVTFPPLINDPTNRVYRGVDPSLVSQDRVEVVTLAHPGTYLVICGFLPHFLDNMHGWVKVVE